MSLKYEEAAITSKTKAIIPAHRYDQVCNEIGATFLDLRTKFIPHTVGVAKGTKISSNTRSVCDVFKASLLWGWKYRVGIVKDEKKIFRIAEPFDLDEQVFELAAPLLKDFR